MKLQSFFEGGFNNKLFEFNGQKYLYQKFSNLKIKFTFSKSNKNGNRSFELNKIIKKKIKISLKLINNLRIFNQQNKIKNI